MKSTRSHIFFVLALAILILGGSGLARAQDPTLPTAGNPVAEPQAAAVALGTAFTYQGRLNDGGSAANGAYDFQFKLFDAASGGTQIGGTLSKNDLPVSGGLFTTDLDFGAGAFDGQARWLEVWVRPGASTGNHTRLDPRRALLASPYATYSNATRGMNVSPTGNRIHITSSDFSFTDLMISNTTSGRAYLGLDASNGDFEGSDYAWIAQYDNKDLVIGNGVAERITVKPNGYVGIGTSNPEGLLNVSSSSPQGTHIFVSNPDHGMAYIQ